MQNSWKIIKEYMIKDSKPGTFGRIKKVAEASVLFAKLSPLLIDKESLIAFNEDMEAKEALILNFTSVKELKDAGVIS